jgi:hypothetical protein
MPADHLGLVGRRHHDKGSLDSGEDHVLYLSDADDLIDKERNLVNAKGGTGQLQDRLQKRDDSPVYPY